MIIRINKNNYLLPLNMKFETKYVFEIQSLKELQRKNHFILQKRQYSEIELQSSSYQN